MTRDELKLRAKARTLEASVKSFERYRGQLYKLAHDIADEVGSRREPGYPTSLVSEAVADDIRGRIERARIVMAGRGPESAEEITRLRVQVKGLELERAGLVEAVDEAVDDLEDDVTSVEAILDEMLNRTDKLRKAVKPPAETVEEIDAERPFPSERP